MAKAKRRQYQCPACKYKATHETNHFGEIYCDCRNCGYMGLYCVEPLALRAKERANKITAKFIFYRFDVSDQVAAEKYQKLCKKLKNEGLTLFDCISCFKLATYKEYNRKQVTIYSPDTFDNQFITDIGRLHNWYEQIYPNRNIKQGYYLKFE